MTSKREAVRTVLGNIRGRDAIFLDKVIHTVSPSILSFSGEISSPLCSNYTGKGKWIAYELKFLRVIAYQCWELDSYPYELEVSTSFDVVKQSSWINELTESTSNHYVLSTYDYIYEIISIEFDFTITNER